MISSIPKSWRESYMEGICLSVVIGFSISIVLISPSKLIGYARKLFIFMKLLLSISPRRLLATTMMRVNSYLIKKLIGDLGVIKQCPYGEVCIIECMINEKRYNLHLPYKTSLGATASNYVIEISKYDNSRVISHPPFIPILVSASDLDVNFIQISEHGSSEVRTFSGDENVTFE